MLATSISVAFFLFTWGGDAGDARKEFQRLGISWNLVSTLISLWTVYAIYKTWQSAEEWPVKIRIFDDFGFAFLTFVTLVIAVLNLSILQVALRVPRNRGRNNIPVVEI